MIYDFLKHRRPPSPSRTRTSNAISIGHQGLAELWPALGVNRRITNS